MFTKRQKLTSPKTNMDTQNDGLEKVDSFEIWPFVVSMLDFWGVLKDATQWKSRKTTSPNHPCSMAIFAMSFGQIVATSNDLTPKCSLGREISLFQGNLGW